MEHYQLQDNEVILYRGDVQLLADGKSKNSNSLYATQSFLILTNLHIIIENTTKKLISQKVDTIIYDTKMVKQYENTPQIIQKGEFVDIYLLGTELFLRFQKKKQATQFNNAALRLLTGESKLVRGVKKGQKAIKETEDALNIDITGTAKNIALTAIDVTSVAQGKKVNTVGNFAKKFLSQKKVKQISAAEDEKKDEDA